MELRLKADDFPTIKGLASDVLNKFVLMVGDKVYNFVEVEMYVNSPDHRDPYVHCSPEQEVIESWYFHKYGGTYKGGTFKGLDITIPMDNESFGGILIRSIAIGNEIIEGPCNVVNRILKDIGCASIVELVNKMGDLNIFRANLLRIAACNNRGMTVYSSPRVGLGERERDYLLRCYRFFTYPRLKKGRPLTIIGLHLDGYTDEHIANLTKSKPKTIRDTIANWNSS